MRDFQAFVAKQMRSALFWDITQRILVTHYRCFVTTYRSHLQRSINSRITSLPLKMGPIGCLETSVRKYY